MHGKRILRLMVELEQVLLARNDISTVQEGANSIVNWLKKSRLILKMEKYIYIYICILIYVENWFKCYVTLIDLSGRENW